MRRRLGFTLIELLTVIAITAVLLTLIILPVFQSFNITRAAQAFADAQDRGRNLSERIAREINGAVSVRATSFSVPTTLNGNPAGLPASSVVVQVPSVNGAVPMPGNAPYEDVALPWAKVDLVPPASGTPEVDPQTGRPIYRDPVTGKIDPTLTAPKGQVRLPLAPGQTIVRYCIGLRDPFSPYNNPYTDYKNAGGTLWAGRNGGRDNLYVLYRLEFQPYVQINGTYLPNVALVGTTADTDPTNGSTMLAQIDDPRFLVAERDANGAVIANSDHNRRIYHWLGRKAPGEDPNQNSSDTAANAFLDSKNFARAVVQTEVSRYDMIQPVVDRSSRVIGYEADNATPKLLPLVQFRPMVVGNEPATGQVAVRPGEESDGAQFVGPEVYQTRYGLWNDARVYAYPAGYVRGDNSFGGYDFAHRNTSTGANVVDVIAPGGSATVFDLSRYDTSVATSYPYAFTEAALSDNVTGNWYGNDSVRRAFVPMSLYPRQGQVSMSFGIDQVGVKGTRDPNGTLPPNLPRVIVTSTTTPLEDQQAGVSYGGTWYDPNEINRNFNKVYNDPNLRALQPTIQRFIDLRLTPNADGVYGPLYPGPSDASQSRVSGFSFPEVRVDPTTNTSYATKGARSRVSIVPGSEVVYGPDQLPGPHWGFRIRYTRTTSSNVGPNQYRINYTDLQEPTESTSTTQAIVSPDAYQQQFNLPAGYATGFDPLTYNAGNFVSAVLQPRFKVGYLQLNSDPNVPIPVGPNANNPVPFEVSYRFQFTQKLDPTRVPAGGVTSDVVTVDYDTRQLMQVLLTVRNYAQSSLPNPQQVTLKATASVRNFTR